LGKIVRKPQGEDFLTHTVQLCGIVVTETYCKAWQQWTTWVIILYWEQQEFTMVSAIMILHCLITWGTAVKTVSGVLLRLG